MRRFKFTNNIDDAWFLRTVFVGNTESVGTYTWWFKNRTIPSSEIDRDENNIRFSQRYIRGREIRFSRDFNFGFEI